MKIMSFLHFILSIIFMVVGIWIEDFRFLALLSGIYAAYYSSNNL